MNAVLEYPEYFLRVAVHISEAKSLHKLRNRSVLDIQQKRFNHLKQRSLEAVKQPVYIQGLSRRSYLRLSV